MLTWPYYAGAAVLMFVLGAWTGIRWHEGRDAVAELAAREAVESDSRQLRRNADDAAGRHESDKAKIRTEVRTVQVEVERVIQAEPAMRDSVCLSPDSLRVLSEAIAGPRAAASEPAPAVRGLAAPSGWFGRIGASLGGGSDRPVPRVPEPPP